MAYLIFFLVALVLFFAFFALTMVEARTGTRILNTPRRKLDKTAGRLFFIAKHVDWIDFSVHVVQSVAVRIAHDVAHWTLIIVRFAERELTGVVRYMRDRRPNVLAPRPSRESPITQTISYFQKMLHLNVDRKKADK